MRKRFVHFKATRDAYETLAEVLRSYAHTAYPPGGSECAANSRQLLLDYATHADNGNLSLTSRQFPMIKAAINWYFSEIEKDLARRDQLLTCFEKD